MPSLGNIADDIAHAMGFDHDDALRNRLALMYNCHLGILKLKKQTITKRLNTGDHQAVSDMVSTFIVPVVHNDVADDVVTDFDAVYFDLPTTVYSLDGGQGINAIRYLRNDIPLNCPPGFALTTFTGTTLAGLGTIYGSAYQKPNTARPYYARARANTPAGPKDRVYLFGVDQSINHLVVALFAIPDFTTLDPDAPVDLPDEMLMTLKKMVMDLEGWALQIPQERLQSDGRDFQPGEVVRTRPLQSINDPSQQDA